jgi:osmoprotectant transport system substrate-binding protein
LIWLQPSPMNDSQGLATTKAIAQRENLSTLSQLAPIASRLRLATIQEFLSRPDGLPGLQKLYGGFQFRDIHTYDIALKYQALLTGKADVASAFTTDGAIASDSLVVLRDDRHLWPPYNVAPVVRQGLLAAQPRVRSVLDGVSPHITDAVAQKMNADVESAHQDPADVAAAFLKSSGIAR